MKKTIISVIGKDCVGIIAKTSAICSKYGVNIIDISQSVMQQDMFVMVMMTDIAGMTCSLSVLKDEMKTLGEELGLDIRVMHEDVFNSMHRI